MASSTDRLRLAPDDHSDTREAERSPQTKERPRCNPRCANTEERGRTTHTSFDTSESVAAMPKSTRAPGRATSGTQRTAVKITLASSAVPATPTSTTA